MPVAQLRCHPLTACGRACLSGLLVLLAVVAIAQEPVSNSETSKKPEPKPVTKNTARTTTPVVVDEKAALQFATTHHPELAEILQTLRKANKQQFQAAITDLSREQERIGRLSERDPDRAKLAIATWQIESRLRLEVARFTMAQDAEREARIKSLLTERAAIRQQTLEFDLRRTQQRLTKLEEQLAQHKGNSEKQVAAEWDRLKKNVAGSAKAKPRTETKK